MLRVIIAGSRSLKDYEFFEKICVDILSKEQHIQEIPSWEIEIVSGNNSSGADRFGEKFSKKHLNKDATLFPAEWNNMKAPVIVGHNYYGTYNKLAGNNRNQKMAFYLLDNGGGICIVFDAEESKTRTETKDMIKISKKSGFKTYHVKCEDLNNVKIKIYGN